MPEPFKNLINSKVVSSLAERLQTAGDFNVDAFVSDTVAGLEELELKDRVRLVASSLRRHMDPDYEIALDHILRSLPEEAAQSDESGNGFSTWAFCQFVETYGLDHAEKSISAMPELTKRFSCEFAIRPYIVSDPETVMKVLARWAYDENVHVRRLASEGSRPRLPWGMRLQLFVENPEPVIELLELLKDDPSEYVRRSVANNLNDISKDHPDRIVQLAKKWMHGANTQRGRLVKHALRSLIKSGHAGALELLGFGEPHVSVSFRLREPGIHLGKSLEMVVELQCDVDQSLLIDYAVHHMKANGKHSPKVFKWTTRKVKAGQTLSLERKHAMKEVTTRRYYAGLHKIELLINGRSFGTQEFDLVVP